MGGGGAESTASKAQARLAVTVVCLWKKLDGCWQAGRRGFSEAGRCSSCPLEEGLHVYREAMSAVEPKL